MAGKSRRGFASMDPAKQREIASKGGRAAHEKGTAHEWSSDEARNAGRKGGEVVSRDRSHMAAIGREGGEARGRKARERKSVPMAAGTSSTTQSPSTSPSSPMYRERESSISVSREQPGMAASDAQSSGNISDRSRTDTRGGASAGLDSSNDQKFGR